MRVIVVSYGTSGDLNPMIELAVALQRQDVDVVFITSPNYADKLDRAGIQHHLLPDGLVLDEVAGDALKDDPKFMERGLSSIVKILDFVFIPQVAPIYELVKEELAAAPTDLVLNHPTVFGSYLAAEEAEAPFARVDFAPFSLVSQVDPGRPGPVMPPRWLLAWMMGWPVRAVVNRVIGRRIDAAAAELGLPGRRTRFFDNQERAVLNLCLWSPLFRGPAEDDHANVRFCGFPLPGAGEGAALEPELEAFLAAGDAPVVVGLGSMLPPFYPEIYRGIWAACQRLGRRAILVGCAEGVIEDPSPDLLTVAYAPYSLLFERADVIVHHGGVGSLTEAFHAGRPQIIIPFGTDQFDNADRAERLGVAVGLTRKAFTARRFEAALKQVLADEDMTNRARGVKATLEGEEAGPIAAATAIVEWIKAR